MQQVRVCVSDLAKYSFTSESAAFPDYEGRSAVLTVADGFVTVDNNQRWVSPFLPDGSKLDCRLVRSSVGTVVVVYDLLAFGSQDLAHIAYGSRLKLLDTLLPSIEKEFGTKMFACKQVAPLFYVAQSGLSAEDIADNEDPRLLGSTVRDLSALDHSGEVLVSKVIDKRVDVDSVALFPPVPNEGDRVKAYMGMVRQNVNKMRGKWRDVATGSHSPGLLPYDLDDLVQFGMLQVMIALRKYNPNNVSKAQEHTFVFAHLYNRFGQLTTKYGKQSRGYGVRVLRDFTNDDGEHTSVFDIIETGGTRK